MVKVFKEKPILTHVHKVSERRYLVRLVVSTETLLRDALGLPRDPKIQDPLPLPREEVVLFLESVVANRSF